MMKGVYLKLKEFVLIGLKKRNKNIIISKKVSSYVHDLISASFPEALTDEYNSIVSGENSSYQTPLAQIAFLCLLIKISKACKVLEVGTFKGFTATCFAEAVGENGSVTACENNLKYQESAVWMWKKFKQDKKIILLQGDASESLANLVNKKNIFDFIYIDADKSVYAEYYHLALKLSHSGTIIAIDNTLWAGLVAEQETNYSHARNIAKLNKEIFGDFSHDKTLISAWDGLTIVKVNK